MAGCPALPFVTVIMPVRNEADFIERSLGTVLCQDYPHDRMEVVVADGLSEDDTRSKIIATSAAHPDVHVTIIDNPGRIAPTGLNLAFGKATGDIIVRVDGHCVIAPDYVSKCVHYLQTTDADGVGGPIETIATTPMGQSIALAMSSKFGVGNSGFRTGLDAPTFVDTIPFPAYTRKVMERAGPYDEELIRNQDDEYNYRLRKLGYKLLLAPDIASTYYSRSSLKSLWRQYSQYGLYKVRVLQKHPRQMQWRQFVPFVFVMSVVISLAGSALVRPLRYASVAIGAAYATANMIASMSVARRASWSMLRYLPVVFAILHFGYGLGFARGLVKFRSGWRRP